MFESIIGSEVLPVEDQWHRRVSSVALDGDNVGVYFEIGTDQFEIDSYDSPMTRSSRRWSTTRRAAGSLVQSGDFYAKKGDVLYKVVAGVTGTEDDDVLQRT